MTLPSIDLYPLHDADGYVEFITGMWLHTTPLVGKPTVREIVTATLNWPLDRRHRLIEVLAKHGQVAP